MDFKSIQDKMKTADSAVKQTYQDKNPNKGYGGKYGTDQVMDKVREEVFDDCLMNIVNVF